MAPEASPILQLRRPARRTRQPQLLVWVGRALVVLGCSALLGWMALAFYLDFSSLGSPWLRAGVGALAPVGGVVALLLVRPLRRVLAGILGAFVVRLRTNFRGEDVYVYRLDASPADARVLLLRYFEEINQLHERPQWYNALTENCTTAIQRLATARARQSWWSWKLLLNGYLDELAYDIGAIDRSLPFSVLKAKSHINERAKAADVDQRFSVRIREGLPRMSLNCDTAGETQ